MGWRERVEMHLGGLGGAGGESEQRGGGLAEDGAGQPVARLLVAPPDADALVVAAADNSVPGGLHGAHQGAVAAQGGDLGLGVAVKDADGLVARARDDGLAVELDAGDALLVADKRLLALGRAQVPQFDDAVARGRDDLVAVQLDGIDGGHVAGQAVDGRVDGQGARDRLGRRRARRGGGDEGVPQAEAGGGGGVGHGPGGLVERVVRVADGGTLGAEDQLAVPRVVGVVGLEHAAVPDLDELVLAARDEPLGREAQVEDGLVVGAWDGVQLLAGREAPDDDAGVGRARDDDVLGGALVELQAEDAAVVAEERLAARAARLDVPDADRAVARARAEPLGRVLDRVDALLVALVRVVWVRDLEGDAAVVQPVVFEAPAVLEEEGPVEPRTAVAGGGQRRFDRQRGVGEGLRDGRETVLRRRVHLLVVRRHVGGGGAAAAAEAAAWAWAWAWATAARAAWAWAWATERTADPYDASSESEPPGSIISLAHSWELFVGWVFGWLVVVVVVVLVLVLLVVLVLVLLL